MKFEKLEKSQVKFTIDVTASEFETALDKAFDIVKEKVEVKGFRKGHVPRGMFEKKFGVEALYEEAINYIVPLKYNEVLTNDEFVIVSQPVIDLDFASLERGKDFTFTATVDVKPEVTLGDYKGLACKQADLVVTDAEVNAQIKSLLEKDASLEPKKEGSLEKGDVAIFDFEGKLDGVAFDGGTAENYELEIGSNQFIPGFEDQMVGMNVGETKDLNVTFPEQYHEASLAGKAVVFTVKLHEIKVKVAKELNDEFVVSLNREGITTVEALRNSILEDLSKKREVQERNRMIDTLVEKATANATFELPNGMVETEKNRMRKDVEARAKQYNIPFEMFLTITGSSLEKFEEELTKEATKKVSYELVIEAIAKAENIEASEEEYANKCEEIAKMYGTTVDQVKQFIPEETVKADVKFQKAIDLLVSSSVAE